MFHNFFSVQFIKIQFEIAEICSKFTIYYQIDTCTSKNVLNHLNCHFYDKINWVGPYCSIWVEASRPFCFLFGDTKGKFCPGAFQWGNESIYWTEDLGVCDRSSNYIEKYC